MVATRTPTPVSGNGAKPPRAPDQAPPTTGVTQRWTRRNRTRAAAGFVLLVVCALGVGVAFSNAAQRSPVLAVAHTVRAGQQITDSDVREVLVGSPPAGSTVSASGRDSVVGHTASIDLPVGALIAPSMVASGPAAASGRSVIGASLHDGQFPAELVAGDRVQIVVLPADNATNDATSPSSPVDATVVGIRPLDQGGVSVSLAVDPSKAADLAVAGARSRLSLVLAP